MDLNEFTDRERQLIEVTKRTLRILAKVMEDRTAANVIKDIELEKEVGHSGLATIIAESDFLAKMIRYVRPTSALTDDDLGKLREALRQAINDQEPNLEISDEPLDSIIRNLEKAINARITPDLPSLGPDDKAMLIGRLGSVIFTELYKAEAADGGGDSD